MNERKDAFAHGYRISIYALVVTLLLAVVKGIVGLLSNSLLLISDAIHSASDLVVISMAILGIKISSRKPSEKFPYGYYKAENIFTLFISISIILAGYEIIRQGYERLNVLEKMNIPHVAIATALLSIIISYLISIPLKKTGKRENMQSLVAVGNERRMDSFSSMVVLVGLILNFYGVKYVEGILSIAISFFIFKTGIESGRDAIYSLMDFSPLEKKRKVMEILEKREDVKGYRDVKLRKSGPFLFGEATIFVRKGYDVNKAHEIADEMEREIREEIPEMDSFIIHVEPYRKEKVRVAIPMEKDKISSHFGRANYFSIWEIDVSRKRVMKKEEVENPYINKKVRAGLALTKLLLARGIDILITREIGEISFHTLADEGVEIYFADVDAESSIKKFMEGKLKRVEKPTKERD